MKVAILSDIHANYTALQTVLDDVKKQGCQKVLCLGDLAMAGAEPERVIDFVKNQDWTVIQGNTDKMIVEYSKELYEKTKEIFPVMANALKSDVDIISAQNKEYLKNLPEKLSLEIEGVKILMVHGSPRRNNEDILPNQPVEVIETIVDGVEEDLILCGHTHVPCGYQLNNKKTVVNAGSVGRPMTSDGRACYVIADFHNGEFLIEHRLLDYDREQTAKLIVERGFDRCQDLAEMILHPKDRHA